VVFVYLEEKSLAEPLIFEDLGFRSGIYMSFKIKAQGGTKKGHPEG